MKIILKEAEMVQLKEILKNFKDMTFDNFLICLENIFRHFNF